MGVNVSRTLFDPGFHACSFKKLGYVCPLSFVCHTSFVLNPRSSFRENI